MKTHTSQYNGVLKTRNSIKYITKYKSNLHNKQLGNHHNGPYGKQNCYFNCLLFILSALTGKMIRESLK